MKSWTFDILTASGLAVLCYGVWQVYPPIAFITVGAALMAAGITGARRWAS